MKKSSAITLTILLMVVVLSILLGYTAYYIDDIMLKPVVNMQTEESDLKCFFAISNAIGGEYFRGGPLPPDNTLRRRLIRFYNLSYNTVPYTGEYGKYFQRSIEMTFGDSKIVVADYNVFWTAVKAEGLNPECTIEIYGPFYTGVVGLFKNKNVDLYMKKWEREIYEK